jgi:hypothetical protein
MSPAADYLTRTIANDNRPPSLFAERLTYAAGMAACFVFQFMWAEFLIGQLRSF